MTTSTAVSTPQTATQQTTAPRRTIRLPDWRTLPFRHRLIVIGAAGFLLALITLLQALNAYNTSYELFRGIAQVNSTTVDASEKALQNIAQASQAAADYALLTSDTPLYEQAQNNIFRDFSAFRDEMFILRGNLQSDAERTAFTVADTFAYSRFWRHVSDLVSQRSNDEQARLQYLEADNHVRSWISPALQELENLNFNQMVAAGDRAGGIITAQVILLAVPAVGLIALLTFLSLSLRRKVRRFLTPGIDAAMVLSWIVLFIVLVNLLNAPNQLNTMIQDAYRSVSASSRVLVDANLANRAESSELLDLGQADAWNQRFDQAAQRVELRLCGQPGCLDNTFITGTNLINQQVYNRAIEIAADNSAQIEGIVPLVANVHFSGVASALERARTAFNDFRTANANLRSLIASNSIPDAITLNTSTDSGSSQEAFDRFATAMDQVRDTNRQVFDDLWHSVSAELLANRLLYGLAGYAAIALLLVVGVYHRYREL
jgi:hypothetical protein